MICTSFSQCFKVDLEYTEPGISGLRAFARGFVESRVLAVILLRLAQYFWAKKGIWRFAPLIRRLNEILTGFECHLDAEIGRGLLLAHTQNCVIGEGVRIGEQVTLYNSVTLGAVTRKGEEEQRRYPIIEDGAIIYVGARVLGPVVVGAGAVVGANSVVLVDVPPGHTAVGIPARILANE